MKTGIIGYGKMGKMIESVARTRGHEVVEIIDPSTPLATGSGFLQNSPVDVYIDFSTPAAILDNIRRACLQKKNIVVGTTGWTDNLSDVRKMTEEAGIGLMWAGNFSPAVQMFFRVIRAAARLADRLPGGDVAVHEVHHRHKADSPSGTALTIANILLKESSVKTEVLAGSPDGKIDERQLQVSSLRVGEISGSHTVCFDFPFETIELTCDSRSREGFAVGAVMAAEWLARKRGFYCFDDVFEEVVGSGLRNF